MALAKIDSQQEGRAGRVEVMGVGTNLENIEEWVNEIWEQFDKDGSGTIDKPEVEKFI